MGASCDRLAALVARRQAPSYRGMDQPLPELPPGAFNKVDTAEDEDFYVPAAAGHAYR